LIDKCPWLFLHVSNSTIYLSSEMAISIWLSLTTGRRSWLTGMLQIYVEFYNFSFFLVSMFMLLKIKVKFIIFSEFYIYNLWSNNFSCSTKWKGFVQRKFISWKKIILTSWQLIEIIFLLDKKFVITLVYVVHVSSIMIKLRKGRNG